MNKNPQGDDPWEIWRLVNYTSPRYCIYIRLVLSGVAHLPVIVATKIITCWVLDPIRMHLGFLEWCLRVQWFLGFEHFTWIATKIRLWKSYFNLNVNLLDSSNHEILGWTRLLLSQCVFCIFCVSPARNMEKMACNDYWQLPRTVSLQP